MCKLRRLFHCFKQGLGELQVIHFQDRILYVTLMQTTSAYVGFVQHGEWQMEYDCLRWVQRDMVFDLCGVPFHKPRVSIGNFCNKPYPLIKIRVSIPTNLKIMSASLTNELPSKEASAACVGNAEINDICKMLHCCWWTGDIINPVFCKAGHTRAERKKKKIPPSTQFPPPGQCILTAVPDDVRIH